MQFAQIADGQPQKREKEEESEKEIKREGDGDTDEARSDCLYICNVCRVSIKQLVDYYLNILQRGGRAGGCTPGSDWECSRIDNWLLSKWGDWCGNPPNPNVENYEDKGQQQQQHNRDMQKENVCAEQMKWKLIEAEQRLKAKRIEYTQKTWLNTE